MRFSDKRKKEYLQVAMIGIWIIATSLFFIMVAPKLFAQPPASDPGYCLLGVLDDKGQGFALPIPNVTDPKFNAPGQPPITQCEALQAVCGLTMGNQSINLSAGFLVLNGNCQWSYDDKSCYCLLEPYNRSN